jgi:hypothetical protein
LQVPDAKSIFLNVKALEKVDTEAEKSRYAIIIDICMIVGAFSTIGGLLFILIHPESKTARPQALIVCFFGIVIALLPVIAWEFVKLSVLPPV